MLHLQNSSALNRKMAKDILRQSRILASGMNLILRDCRVSKKYIEFDTTIPQSSLDELIEKFESGIPVSELTRRPPLPEGVTPFDMVRT